MEKNYELLAGEYPQATTDLILVIEPSNKIDKNTMMALGFDTENVEIHTFFIYVIAHSTFSSL